MGGECASCSELYGLPFFFFFFFTDAFPGSPCRVRLTRATSSLRLLAAPPRPRAQRAPRTALPPGRRGGERAPAQGPPPPLPPPPPRRARLPAGRREEETPPPPRAGAGQRGASRPPSPPCAPGQLRRRPGQPGEAEPGLAGSGAGPAEGAGGEGLCHGAARRGCPSAGLPVRGGRGARRLPRGRGSRSREGRRLVGRPWQPPPQKYSLTSKRLSHGSLSGSRDRSGGFKPPLKIAVTRVL